MPGHKRSIPLGQKDENGIYVRVSPPVAPSAPLTNETPRTDVTIDELMARGLANIERLMRVISIDISGGTPERNTVMNLKDCMAMLQTLKEHESALLEDATDEQLEALVSKK